MTEGTWQEAATLLDILVDGFEKNEIWDGFHMRELPMPDEAAAVRKFGALVDEATRWKGQPARRKEEATRRLAAWPDLDIRQAGCGVMVRARAPWFDPWWHQKQTGEGDPMGAIRDWLREDRDST
ncbi:MAG TPA: hypothetical protein VF469_37130 [Kofleriaceae bacterium]